MGKSPSSILIYDKSGLRDTMYDYDMSGKLTSKIVYNYDLTGNMISQFWYMPNGKMNYKEIYGYDETNNKISEIRIDSSGRNTSKILYKYDDKKNVIMEIDSGTYRIGGFGVYDKGFKEGDIHTLNFRYSHFDQYGNWLQMDSMLDDKAVRTMKRRIEYYP